MVAGYFAVPVEHDIAVAVLAAADSRLARLKRKLLAGIGAFDGFDRADRHDRTGAYGCAPVVLWIGYNGGARSARHAASCRIGAGALGLHARRLGPPPLFLELLFDQDLLLCRLTASHE